MICATLSNLCTFISNYLLLGFPGGGECHPLKAMEDEGSSFPLERLTSIPGTDHAQHFPALIHLVVADYTYYNHSETIY